MTDQPKPDRLDGDDPTSNAQWNEGCDFAMTQLCIFLGVDPASVTWDAATETVDGDVRAVIGGILRAKFGEDWGPSFTLSPTRDAAEGAEDAEWCKQAKATLEHLGGFLQKTGAPHRVDWREWIDSADKHLGLKWPSEAQASAPPKPAPDAIRSLLTVAQLLQRACDGATFGGETWLQDTQAVIKTAEAFLLSAPVPPADGAREELLKYLDIFLHPNPTIDLSGLVCKHGLAIEACMSRECENPMAYETVIKRARDYIAALSPSGTGAAEPVAGWQWRYREAHQGAPWTGWGHVQDVEAFRKLWKNQMVGGLTKAAVELRPVYATPPVRGDRETIARTNLIRDSVQRVYDEMCVQFSGVHSDDKTDSWLLNLHYSLKLLSLPVPPGAGERPRWRHKKRGTLYTEIGRGELQTMDAGGLTDGEPMVIYQGDDGKLWVRDVVEFEDGRFEFVPPSSQAPHSGREGGR